MFSKFSFKNTTRVSNGLDPDQDRHSVGPDLVPNCLQRLSADDKVATSKERVKTLTTPCYSAIVVLTVKAPSKKKFENVVC